MPEKPSESPSPPPSSPPLDAQNIHRLVRLMKRYDLTAIDLIDGATKIRLRRRGPEATGGVPQPMLYAPQNTAPLAPPAAVPTPAAAPVVANDPIVESPMVGTFYSSPAPDAPPFISVGSTVRPDTTVCVIEAMKVFTDIPAGLSGTITEVLVKSGQPVEFGQALFKVRPS